MRISIMLQPKTANIGRLLFLFYILLSISPIICERFKQIWIWFLNHCVILSAFCWILLCRLFTFFFLSNFFLLFFIMHLFCQISNKRLIFYIHLKCKWACSINNNCCVVSWDIPRKYYVSIILNLLYKRWMFVKKLTYR